MQFRSSPTLSAHKSGIYSGAAFILPSAHMATHSCPSARRDSLPALLGESRFLASVLKCSLSASTKTSPRGRGRPQEVFCPDLQVSSCLQMSWLQSLSASTQLLATCGYLRDNWATLCDEAEDLEATAEGLHVCLEQWLLGRAPCTSSPWSFLAMENV